MNIIKIKDVPRYVEPRLVSVWGLMASLYNEGKTFWYIYNQMVKGKQGVYLEDAVWCINDIRRYVLSLYPELNFNGARSGVEIPYWEGCVVPYPNFQITKNDLRLTFFNFPNAPYLTNGGNDIGGEFMFGVMVPLPPDDVKRYEQGGKKAVNFGDIIKQPIVKFKGRWCFESVNHDTLFAMLYQYIIDLLLEPAYRWYVGSRKIYPTLPYPAWVVNYLAIFSSKDSLKSARALGEINLIYPPELKTTLLEKIAAGFSIGVAAVLTVVTAGAGSPILATIVSTLLGRVIKKGTDVLVDKPDPVVTNPPAGSGQSEQPEKPTDNDGYKKYLYIGAGVVALLLLSKKSKR